MKAQAFEILPGRKQIHCVARVSAAMYWPNCLWFIREKYLIIRSMVLIQLVSIIHALMCDRFSLSLSVLEVSGNKFVCNQATPTVTVLVCIGSRCRLARFALFETHASVRLKVVL